MQFNIGLKGSGLRLLYPDSVRTDFGVNLAMTGNTDAALLQGQVSIDRISFTPDFDLVQFRRRSSAECLRLRRRQSFADNLRLNVALSLRARS